MKVLLKACRRCGGDLFPDGDDGEHPTLACLQCGFSVRLVPARSRPQLAAVAHGPRAA